MDLEELEGKIPWLETNRNMPQLERRKYPDGVPDRRLRTLPKSKVTWKKQYFVRSGLIDRRGSLL